MRFFPRSSYEGETEAYQKVLGKVNQRLGIMADSVVEVVYGIPVYHKKGGDFHESHGTALRLPLPCSPKYRCPAGRMDKGKHEVHVLFFSFYRRSDRSRFL